MDAIEMLKEAGFARVIALDASACCAEFDHGTLLLAVWQYQAERMAGARGAWIHPYYPASQLAYTAAKNVVVQLGDGAQLRPDIRLKPLFARLPMFTQGRNTLSYLEGVGSNIHVQTIYLEETLEDLMRLEAQEHPLHCGSCRACMKACPGGAIDENGFHREKCIRNWMLTGKSVPEELRAAMGNRLLGCDECQRCCPHNPPAKAETTYNYPLEKLLCESKDACEELKPMIGANLALPNRVAAQACIIAGNSGCTELLPMLRELEKHPSQTVGESASWAVEQLEKIEK